MDYLQGLELSVRIAKKTGESGSDFASRFSNVSEMCSWLVFLAGVIKDCYHESNQLLAVTQLIRESTVAVVILTIT